MLRSKRFYALVLVALILVVASTATATSVALVTGRQVEDGSLSGLDLANRSVGAKKLLRRSLTTLEVKDGTLEVADLSPAAIASLRGAAGPAGAQGAAGAPGPAGPQGPAGSGSSGVKLAGYVQAGAQTLPGDSQFRPVWTMTVTAAANQIFIVTGSIGNENANCQVDRRVTVDGSPDPSVFNGGFLRLSAGSHAVTYEVSAPCPIDVPSQEVVAIPFTLP